MLGLLILILQLINSDSVLSIKKKKNFFKNDIVKETPFYWDLNCILRIQSYCIIVK